MIAVSRLPAYVDPFDRICHGLGNKPATTDPKEAHLSVPDRRITRKNVRRIGNNPAASPPSAGASRHP